MIPSTVVSKESLPLSQVVGKPAFLVRAALHREALNRVRARNNVDDDHLLNDEVTKEVESRAVKDQQQLIGYLDPATGVFQSCYGESRYGDGRSKLKQKEERKAARKKTTESAQVDYCHTVDDKSVGCSTRCLPHPTNGIFNIPVTWEELLKETATPAAGGGEELSSSTTVVLPLANLPYYAKIAALHNYCEMHNRDCYKDPVTGELAFTRKYLVKQQEASSEEQQQQEKGKGRTNDFHFRTSRHFNIVETTDEEGRTTPTATKSAGKDINTSSSSSDSEPGGRSSSDDSSCSDDDDESDHLSDSSN